MKIKWFFILSSFLSNSLFFCLPKSILRFFSRLRSLCSGSLLRAQAGKQAKQHTQCVYILLTSYTFFTTPNVDRGKTIQRPIARSFNSDFFSLLFQHFFHQVLIGVVVVGLVCFRNNAHTFSWCGRYLKHYTVFFIIKSFLSTGW